MRRCLAKCPDDRFAGYQELRSELARFATRGKRPAELWQRLAAGAVDFAIIGLPLLAFWVVPPLRVTGTETTPETRTIFGHRLDGTSSGISGSLASGLQFKKMKWDDGEITDVSVRYSGIMDVKPLKQSLPELKSMRANVPATLMGVFGVDFAGDALRRMMFLPYLLILAVGAGLGYLLGPVCPSISWKIGGHLICWLPPLVAIYLNVSIGGVLKACVESVKTIYFTIFYTTIMHSDEIPVEYRDQLMGYLRMEPAAEVPAATAVRSGA